MDCAATSNETIGAEILLIGLLSSPEAILTCLNIEVAEFFEDTEV
jgi:hypothetical protein